MGSDDKEYTIIVRAFYEPASEAKEASGSNDILPSLAGTPSKLSAAEISTSFIFHDGNQKSYRTSLTDILINSIRLLLKILTIGRLRTRGSAIISMTTILRYRLVEALNTIYNVSNR